MVNKLWLIIGIYRPLEKVLGKDYVFGRHSVEAIQKSDFKKWCKAYNVKIDRATCITIPLEVEPDAEAHVAESGDSK